MKKLLFLILLLTAGILAAQNVPLTLVAPNGGETWQIGSTQNIVWTPLNIAGGVRLMLLGANSTVGTLIAQNIPASTGTYAWAIPSTVLPGSYYRVGIYLQNSAGTTTGDLSDGTFSIVGSDPPPPPPPQQGITVLSPNGGEIWNTGATYPITWTSIGLEGTVRISVVQANSSVTDIQIATEVPIESGQFNWTIPATFPTGSGFKVHVRWLSLLTVYFGDLSDGVFTIADPTPPPPQPLAIISPNGGEVWQSGTQQSILWTASNQVGSVDLMLLNGLNSATPPIPIASNLPASAGNYLWNIPTGLIASSNYFVRIASSDPATGVFFSDFSDAPFTITAGTNPSLIQVLSPNGGETWQIGSTHPIEWATPMLAGVYEVALMRTSQAAPVLVIAPNIPGIMALNWTIPTTVPPGNNYKIRVRLAENAGAFDLSDGTFSIVAAPVPQTLTVTSPNGGESWVKGSVNTITWTDSDPVGNVNIWLVRLHNSARMQHIIATNIPNTGSYAWTIPPRVIPGNGYFIMIRKVDNPLVFDRSDNPFTILGQLNDLQISPNPTHGKTKISMDIKAPVTAEITIYNLKGQKVRTLSSGTSLDTGSELEWDGTDFHGQKVQDGIYFVRAVNGEEVLTKRIVLIK